MARLARIVVPGMPHHVTQRGNRRQPTFFCEDDYAAHLQGKDDCLVKVAPLLEIAGNWRRLLTSAVSDEELNEFRAHERTGRVLGHDDFQKRLERKLGRVLRRRKPGPKKASTR